MTLLLLTASWWRVRRDQLWYLELELIISSPRIFPRAHCITVEATEQLQRRIILWINVDINLAFALEMNLMGNHKLNSPPRHAKPRHQLTLHSSHMCGMPGWHSSRSRWKLYLEKRFYDQVGFMSLIIIQLSQSWTISNIREIRN